MDGSDALGFRRMLPDANVLALEPNPRNFALMEADRQLERQSIRVLQLAASNRCSEAPFFVVTADYTGSDYRRGMSSLYRRPEDSMLTEVVQVPTVRIDQLLAEASLNDTRVALWLDTEGMAFEVIMGAKDVLPSTLMIHVEVETEAIIGRDQKLFEHVESVLTESGFVLFATDQPRDCLQFNALYIRSDELGSRRVAIRFWALAVQLRRLVARRAHRVLPESFRYAIARLLH